MKRTIFLLLVLSGMVVPCRAVKRVTAAQFEPLVTGLHDKPDADLAYQIGDLELSERLSAERTDSLRPGFALQAGTGSLRIIVVDENSGRMGSVTLPANGLLPSS